MPVRPLHALASLLAAALIGGCAQVPTEMRYTPQGRETVQEVFPAQQPRYRYVGELLGEQNFGPAERGEPGLGQRMLRWIVGLQGGPSRDRRVLLRPQSGMVDAAGRVLVTDAGRQAVFVFDAPQGRLQLWEEADDRAPFQSPVGIAAGPPGEILVADAGLGRVVRLDGSGRALGSFGAGVLERPTGLARDPATGEVFVADTRAHDVKVFDAGGRLLRRIGRPGTRPGEFNAPTHLALAGGALYVADTLNARVQVLAPDGTPLRSVGRRGLYVGNLTRPKGVTVDSHGNTYVIESYYDHLLIYDPQGRFLLPIGGTGAGAGQFFLPAGLWSDAEDRIFVADMFNGRVVIFEFLGGEA